MIKNCRFLCFPIFVFSILFLIAQENGYGAEKDFLNRLVSESMFTVPGEILGDKILSKENIKSPQARDGVLVAPFASEKTQPRFSFDEKVDLDLSEYSLFYLDVQSDHPDALRSCSLYFHSENGWFSIPGSAKGKLDPHSLRFTFSAGDARKEENPTGLHKIDTIRISFWRTVDVDTTVNIQGFYGGYSSVCILDTDKTNHQETQNFVNRMENFFKISGFSCRKADLENLNIDTLKKYKTVVIPIQGDLNDNSCDLLCDYLDQGGFIIGFYSLPAKLMKKMGFAPAVFYPNTQKGEPVEKIVFTEEFKKIYAPFMPDEMLQNSYNFCISKPLEKDLDPFLQKEENTPHIAGWWYNPQGEKMKYPAILRSGRGIFYSHVLIPDDITRKQAFFFAVLQNSDPSIYIKAFYENWYRLFNYGMVPDENRLPFYRERATDILRRLNERGWSENKILNAFDQIKSIHSKSPISSAIKVQIKNFFSAIDEIYKECSNAYAQKIVRLPGEKWFCWEHSGVGPYPGDWDRSIREIAAGGYNGIVPNMLWGGCASYNSKVLPHDEKFEKYGDQIEQIVQAGKKYGVEIHVWKVCYNCSRAPKSFTDQMKKEGRVQKSSSGKPYTSEWLCPSHPKNQDLEVAAMIEIAENYKVDGIHFDYIRYPGPHFCFCEGCRDRFSVHYKNRTGKDLAHWPDDVVNDKEIRAIFDQWRCDQITAVVRRVRETVDQKHLPVKISAAVFSGYPGTLTSVAQDWVLWCKKGYLDFVCPMNYTDDPNQYKQLVEKQISFLEGSVPMYSGIGATVPVALSPDKYAAQIEISRKGGAKGICMFDLSKSTMKFLVPAFKKPDSQK
ncbi:MAG: family 10 glycosylhydrolase [Planctomycetia bacterium]|nr:family 10 glycosylhydrolase [Planctomycetia bacterium]